LLPARRDADGRLRPVGSVSLGPRRREALVARQTTPRGWRRGKVRRVVPVVEGAVDRHGTLANREDAQRAMHAATVAALA
jgi:hypothetical protein